MLDFTRNLALALALTSTALPLAAQETTTEAPAEAAPAESQPADPNALSMGEEVSDRPELYVKSTHGDWKLRCIRMADGSDPCELFQLLQDDKGSNVAEVTLLPLQGETDAAAGATVIVPLETLLTEQLTIQIDGGKPRRYPFTFCASIGCVARVGFTVEDVESLKQGTAAKLSVVPAVAPDQVVAVSISLKGFTEAFEAIKAELPQQ